MYNLKPVMWDVDVKNCPHSQWVATHCSLYCSEDSSIPMGTFCHPPYSLDITPNDYHTFLSPHEVAWFLLVWRQWKGENGSIELADILSGGFLWIEYKKLVPWYEKYIKKNGDCI